MTSYDREIIFFVHSGIGKSLYEARFGKRAIIITRFNSKNFKNREVKLADALNQHTLSLDSSYCAACLISI